MIITQLKLTLFSSLIVFTSLTIAAPPESIGIVGDSLATGASTDESIKYTFPSLFKSIFTPDKNLTEDDRSIYRDFSADPDNLDAPKRIFNDLAGRKPDDNVSKAAVKTFLFDTTEKSFGYLVGKSLQIPSKNIVMVAQAGKKVNSINTQFEHLLTWNQDPSNPRLPDVVLVSFTANDICTGDIFNQTPDEIYKKYYSILKEAFINIQVNAPHATKGTRIVVVGALNPTQVLTNPNLLQAKRRFKSQEMTCEEIRSADNKGALGFAVSMCPNILNTRPNNIEKVEHLNKAWQAVRNAQEIATRQAHNHRKMGYKFQFVDGVSQMQLEDDEVSNDCFHPSFKGQARIADIVLDALEEDI